MHDEGKQFGKKRINQDKYHNDKDEGTVDWYLENIRENFEREVDVVEDNVQEIGDEINEDFPKYSADWVQEWKEGGSDIGEYWDYFRWVLNAAFIAMPLSGVALVFLIFNWYESIEWQRVWANGNIILISKTVYMTI